MEVPTTAEAASAPTKPEEDRSKMPQRRRLDLAITQYEKGDSGAVKTAKRALKIVREKRHYNRYLLRFLMGAKDKGFKLKEELRLSQEEALRVAWDQYVELRQQELKQRATLNTAKQRRSRKKRKVNEEAAEDGADHKRVAKGTGAARSGETVAARKKRLARKRKKMAAARAAETEEEREKRLFENRQRAAAARAAETVAEREKRLRQQRRRAAKKRAAAKAKARRKLSRKKK
eukprot:INCI4148.1.p2 GENE.INCI4148.1~~INCI4148.1.p2  ORF type:complete len:233 (+),score=60.33 INCI4148.1:171-869(+)